MHTFRVAAVCLALCLPSVSSFGQTRQPTAKPQTLATATPPRKPVAPPPRELQREGAIRFPTPAPTYVVAWDHCDEEGNIYVVYSATKTHLGPSPSLPPNLGSEPIRKLSLNSRNLTEYATPSLSGFRTLARVAFSVDRTGNVYGLFRGEPSPLSESGADSWPYIIVKFNDDGSLDSAAVLGKSPFGIVNPYQFAAFASGNFLVTGITYGAAPGTGEKPAGGAGPFAGIFDRQGRFVQEVRLPGDVGPSSKPASVGEKRGKLESGVASGGRGSQAKTPPQMRWRIAVDNSILLTGPQDTIYLLRPAHPAMLYKIASDGRVLHQTHIDYPDPNLRLMTASLAGRSRLLINFFGTKADKRGGFLGYSVFATVDSDTGKVTATYKLPSGVSQYFACATDRGNFEFVGPTNDGNLEVVRYSGN
jgi:hypothetical protein